MKKTKFFLIGMAAWLTACGTGESEYDASGIFEATEVIVSAKGNGEIKQFSVEEGLDVEAGSPLGYIDTMQLSLKRRQLMANLSATDSRRLNENRQLSSLRQRIENTRAEQRRYEALVKAKAATPKQLDDINYELNVLERQLSATAEQISSQNTSLSGQSAGIAAQVAQIDDQLQNCIIASPIRGTVLTKYAEAGEYAQPGRALFKVADVEDMKLRAYITAVQLTDLRLGQTVTVFADRGEEERRSYEGTVIWIADKAEFTPKTIQTRDERANLVYAVKIAVKNDGLIKQGMYGEVKF